MIPLYEGNEQCRECQYFDYGYGCVPTYNEVDPPCGRNVTFGANKKGFTMDHKAIEIVRKYIEEHLDKSDAVPEFDVFTVWKCKALQNWKWLLSSTLFDGMYYEVTYNGDKHEFYLDAYKKFENRCIPEMS